MMSHPKDPRAPSPCTAGRHSPSAPAKRSRWVVASVCVLLAVVTWLVFGQTLRHEFVNFDDDVYVTQNPTVSQGLTPAGAARAFTQRQDANWHPLTTLSHMLDCEVFGLNPGGHHFTSVLLHGIAAILLFLVLRNLTGALWPSAFVAAVFAVHPLRAESVAWVAERKDVLSGVFFMLTLWTYAGSVRQPKSRWRRGLVLGLFACGLMCKPMLVSLPFVLLLLDYWPLRRFGSANAGTRPFSRELIVEKLPLVALSVAACAITLLAQSAVIQRATSVPFPLRIGNALVSYAVYLRQTFWPAGLAAYYPISDVSLGEAGLALTLLLAISVAAWRARQQQPYWLVGWLWYLGMLMPVIGLVQVGGQAHADRYTYLPQIGVGVAVTWGVVAWARTWRWRRWVLGGGAAGVLAALLIGARAQVAHWRDSETLWTRALACTTSNALAESNLGNHLFQKGRLDEAIQHCEAALQLQPDDAGVHNCLGFSLFQKGQVDAAFPHLERALQLQPDFAAAHNNLGLALMHRGQLDEAIAQFQAALKVNPKLADAHSNLGVALLQRGQVKEAVVHYEKAVELNPGYAGACNNLAWVLATYPDTAIRNGARAIELAERAVRLTEGRNLVILRTRAAAYAETGRFVEAIQSARQALEQATAQGSAAWTAALQQEIQLYQAGQPLRDPANAASQAK